jgi:hypothetical protein
MCGKETTLYEHLFYSGTCPESVPSGKEWTPETLVAVKAALYFNTYGNFCSAKCVQENRAGA